MKRLEYFQNAIPENSSYSDRKLQFPDENHINLYGVRGAGKSAFVADYLQDMDEETLLYIDCEDPNLTFAPSRRQRYKRIFWRMVSSSWYWITMSPVLSIWCRWQSGSLLSPGATCAWRASLLSSSFLWTTKSSWLSSGAAPRAAASTVFSNSAPCP